MEKNIEPFSITIRYKRVLLDKINVIRKEGRQPSLGRVHPFHGRSSAAWYVQLDWFVNRNPCGKFGVRRSGGPTQARAFVWDRIRGI